jgi:membrane-bound lytic murein transglycosylase D
MSFRIYILSIAFLIAGCAHQNENIKRASSFSEQNTNGDLFLSTDVTNSIDSIHIYYQHALNSLHFKDSLGAEIYFDKAFGVVSKFDEETKTVLMEWQAYDSLITEMGKRYEKIFGEDIFEQAAEEVRQELTQIEETAFGDSLEIPEELAFVDTSENYIPLQINHRVELAMKYFQTKGRAVFTRWLERSGKYEPLVKSILREHDLPEDLFYLAMIESGFNPGAYSYARASGMWQFISATGKYYGLRSDWWFDERRDPMLATVAAAKHLTDLYERFDDWYLALAGYNCNPKKIERRIRQYNTRDFWKLKRLPRQTRNYIPTYIAATIMAKNPKKYGFYVEKQEPIQYDTVIVSEAVDLNVVAKCVDATFTEIKALNPAVRRWCTPPGIGDFVLNIPRGSKDKFAENYAKIPDKDKRSWVRHKIRSGETLSTIARKYATTVSVIKSQNGIRGTVIRKGDYLIIPVPQNKNYYKKYRTYAQSSPRKKTSHKQRQAVIPSGHKKISYIVKTGDTLGEIAEEYNTRASNIRAWNGLYYGQHIYPKQKLAIWIPESGITSSKRKFVEVSPPGSSDEYYVVRSGDTLWDIAQKHGVSISNIKKWNNKRSNTIRPGEKLRIKQVRGG